MTQAGGPAALNGFLYQILQHLGWITGLTLSHISNSHGLGENFCLVLEPASGGDARAQMNGSGLVEQYKSRAGGTWSVNSIIDKALPDLAKAAATSNGQASKYRFVTDGRPGKLDLFRGFLERTRAIEAPDKFDATIHYQFGKGINNFSDRDLFLHIITQIWPEKQKQNCQQQVALALLRNFEMSFEETGGALIEGIDAILRRHAPDLGAEEDIRRKLIGKLLEELSKGELHLDKQGIDELLRSVGLNPERMRKLAQLNATMADLALGRIACRGYQRENDIRQPPPFPKDKSVLLITGDSGNGKTWQLYKLLETLTKSGEIVVMAASASDASTILRNSANDVWQTGLGETNEKTPQALTRHYCDMIPGAAMPWLAIAVDDIQNVDLARQLVQQDWAAMGMRLVFTAPAHIGHSLAIDQDAVLQIHSVDQFSIDELNQILGRPVGAGC